jgi:hypothetical protein
VIAARVAVAAFPDAQSPRLESERYSHRATSVTASEYAEAVVCSWSSVAVYAANRSARSAPARNSRAHDGFSIGHEAQPLPIPGGVDILDADRRAERFVTADNC